MRSKGSFTTVPGLSKLMALGAQRGASLTEFLACLLLILAVVPVAAHELGSSSSAPFYKIVSVLDGTGEVNFLYGGGSSPGYGPESAGEGGGTGSSTPGEGGNDGVQGSCTDDRLNHDDIPADC